MKCPRCQQDNPSQPKFCLECGAPVDGPAPVPKSYADLKGEIEGLKGENEGLRRSLAEALDQQTATAEILRVISQSPTDIQPVLNAVAESAARLCEAFDASIYRRDVDRLLLVAKHGPLPIGPVGEFSLSLVRRTGAGRAVLDGRTVHVADMRNEANEFPESTENARRTGFRTILVVPLMREGAAIGTINLRRTEVQPFTMRQVALLQTFADQAVIAIENVRLFNELQSSNRELTTALDTQTATSEILRVISGSPTDVQPVFDAIVRSALQLLGGHAAVLLYVVGGDIHVGAYTSTHRGGDSALASRYPMPIEELARKNPPLARVLVEGLIDHVSDTEEPSVGDFARSMARARGHRSRLMVPLRRNDTVLGGLAVTRVEPRPFSEDEIALLQTFADQAVIAIENVRLFKELESRNRDLTEALDQQTATSEILRVISRSQTNVQPVFDAIMASAVRLLRGYTGALTRVACDQVELAAHVSFSEAAAVALRALFPRSLQSEGPAAQTVRDRASVNIADQQTDPQVPEPVRAMARASGHRSVVWVPLLHHDEAVGGIGVTRREPGGFTDDEIALLQTFADQAVIAIENVRLFTELQTSNRELTTALDTQTATSDILRVISRSQTDVQPVFDAILQSSLTLCDAPFGVVLRLEGDEILHLAAVKGPPRYAEILRGGYPHPLTRDRISGLAILERRAVQAVGLRSSEQFPQGRALANAAGFDTTVFVPMLKEGHPIGAIGVVGKSDAFSDDQIALLQTFADQAVIAIENVRLFKELEARNRDLHATGEILQVISRSPTDEKPVFDSIVRSTIRLCDAKFCVAYRYYGEQLHVAAHDNLTPEMLALLDARYPQPPSRETATGVSTLEGRIVHIPDASADDLPPASREFARQQGWGSMLAVPLLRDGQPVGNIAVARVERQPFTEQQIALVQTFADQAVIAIENVRLFKELEARNSALTESLEQQTASSEILRVISRSPTDVQPVFDTIVRSADRLCNGVNSAAYLYDGELIHHVALSDPSPEAREEFARQFPQRPNPELGVGRAVLTGAIAHSADVLGDPNFGEGARRFARLRGFRALLLVPMLRAGRVVGVISVGRAEPGLFPGSQVTLLQTFADQAVIAIENVRLFTELQASNRELTTALDTQTATSDILRVISRSQTDVQPVFEAILASAVRLLGAYSGALTRIEGDQVALAAMTSIDDAGDAVMKAFFPQSRESGGTHPQVIRDRAPLNIADAQTDSRLREAAHANARARGYRSQAVVPLLRQDEAVGTISVTRREPGGFTADEIALLQTFADQAVIAIENARLLTELQARTQELTRSVDQLTALGDVGRAVSSSLDLDTVLTTIVDRAVQLSGTDGGTIFEYDEGAEEFTARATLNANASQSALLRATRLRRGEGAVGQMAVTREPFQIPDIATEGAYESRIRGPMLASGTRSVLAIPLLHEERLVGGLVVTRRAAGTFTDDVVALLRTFATQSALAIQNARLFREIEDKSRQLEVASQHKSEFLANMSHELRTPLNAIIGFSEVLTDRMFGELNEKQDEYLKDIHASGQHLLSLINDILDLSKIEAGRMELELTDFNLPATLDNALTLVRERAGRRGIALGLTVDERLEQIRADERKVRQVVLNLLSNAIKFTPEGGRIEVRAVPVDGMVEIAVSDTGVGIAPEDQEAIFEEFKQVGTAAKKVEGTGLGLALSRKFVELHGGRIWVKSELGAGSTFTFTIPTRIGA